MKIKPVIAGGLKRLTQQEYIRRDKRIIASVYLEQICIRQQPKYKVRGGSGGKAVHAGKIYHEQQHGYRQDVQQYQKRISEHEAYRVPEGAR